MSEMPFEAKRSEKGKTIKGRQLPVPPPSECAGYCQMCGRCDDTVLLATVRDWENKPLTFCGKCYKWWHIKQGCRVRRILDVDSSSVSQDRNDRSSAVGTGDRFVLGRAKLLGPAVPVSGDLPFRQQDRDQLDPSDQVAKRVG